MKIIWKISANGDGTATLEGYDKEGGVPTGEITLPAKVSGNLITRVDCNLGDKVTKLIVPGSIKKVVRVANDNLSLREVVIQEGVEQLGTYSLAWAYRPFAGCKNLSKVQLPKSLKVIDERCFYYCESLESISLPEGLTQIGEGAFENSGLTEIVVPSTVEKIGGSSFKGTDLKKAVLRCSVTGGNMFKYCDQLESVELNDKITEVSYGMFYGCSSLKKITLPKNIKEIGSEAFRECTALTQISIPESVTYMDMYAFAGCTALKKVNILGSITVIRPYTFNGCKQLQAIYIPMTVNEIGSYAFRSCVNLQDVYYPLNEAAWTKISISGSDNGFLTAADLHTNAGPMLI